MCFAHAGLAQLVEHLIRNEGVVGSSPITGTINKKATFVAFFFFNAVFLYTSIPRIYSVIPLILTSSLSALIL